MACYRSVWLLLSLLSSAGVVTDVPPGETRIDLVVCPDDDPCARMAYDLELIEPARVQLPFDLLLERDGGEWEDGELLSARFDAAMGRARAAWAAGRIDEADRALGDARRALASWSGTADPQRLFDLAFLDGAVAVRRGEDPEPDFRQAAAVAWNRTVTLPVDEPAAPAYYAVLDRLVKEGTGTLRLATAPGGGTWFLDGVDVGGGPAVLTVFPGTHRVTMQAPSTLRTWRKDVVVGAGRPVDVSATLGQADDAAWVRAQVRAAFDSHTLPKEVRDLVSGWCARKGVSHVRFVRLRDGRPEALAYSPTLRRLEP